MCVTERWTDTLVYVKNIQEDVTLDDLKDVFNDAEDIVFAKQDTRRNDDDKTKCVPKTLYSKWFFLCSK